MSWHKTPSGLTGQFFGKRIDITRASRGAFPYRVAIEGVESRALPNSGYARTMSDAKSLAMDYLQQDKEATEAKADEQLLTPADKQVNGLTKVVAGKEMSESVTTFFASGVCKAESGMGAGGWAIIALHDNGLFADQISGGNESTTANKMELVAALEAVRRANGTADVCIYMDSRYVVDGITKWIEKWKGNGWRSATGGQIKNMYLWKTLDEERSAKRIRFELACDATRRAWVDKVLALATHSSQTYLLDAEQKVST